MDLSYVSFLLFAAFSGLRVFSYLPQIYRVATDSNGATAIAYSTWFMWVGANTATALYAAVNLNDRYLASVSGIFAICCAVVIVLTYFKRRRLRPARAHTGRPAMATPLRPATQMAGMVLGSVVAILVAAASTWIAADAVLSPAAYAGLPSTETTSASSPRETGASAASAPQVGTVDRQALQLRLGTTVIALTRDGIAVRTVAAAPAYR